MRVVGDTYDYGYVGHKRRFTGHIAGLHLLAQSLLQKASQAASAGAPAPFISDSSFGVHPISVYATFETGSRNYTLVPHDKTAVAGFEAFDALVGLVLKSVAPQEAATRNRLENYDDLEAVSLEQGPFLRCFGAAFTFRRSAPGSAFLENHLHTTLSTALFGRVVSILREEDAAWLDEDYQIRAADTGSVRLTLRYKTFDYTVDAPDQMTWPGSLSDIVARIDEAVLEGSADASFKTCLTGPPRYL